MPEKSPTGLLPRSVEVILKQDLVDEIKPGDRARITGVFKSLVTSKTVQTGVFKTVLVATNISQINKQEINMQLDMDDMKTMQQIAKKKAFFNLLARSIGPSIEGHLEIKKGILLMLVGGTEKNLENGTHLRGDINILMVGDPGTAKS